MHKHYLVILGMILFMIPVAFSQSANETSSSFILEYYEPNAEMVDYASLIIQSEIIDEAVADLEELFNLPLPIKIVFASGIPGPQYFQGVINMPYEFLFQNHQVLAAAQYYDTDEEVAETLLNLTEFVLYHEVGHALCDVLDIPVLGREEDAVDGFAAVLSTIWDLDEVALSAADVMDASSSLAAGTVITEAQFWDTHSLDEQRMFNIFCLIYGSDPKEHSTLLYDVGMPAEQSARCQYDYSKVYRNWGRVLDQYLRE